MWKSCAEMKSGQEQAGGGLLGTVKDSGVL